MSGRWGDVELSNPVDSVNLLICTNAAYLQHAAVCLRSLLENNRDLFFNVVVVGRLGEALDENKLRRSIEATPWHRLEFRSFEPPIGQVLPLNPRANYTLDIWTRIWVADFFDRETDKVLYLDADIVVRDSIRSLWETDLGGALLGAVDIPGSMRGAAHLGMKKEDGYFNSGVLLFNLKLWRECKAVDTLLEYVSEHYQRLRDPDQDAMNVCFSDRRVRLGYKWNAIDPFFRDPSPFKLPQSILEKVRSDAVLVHYNGPSKPWFYLNNHPLRGEYWKYLAMTEWREYIPPDRTLKNICRELLGGYLPGPVKTVVKKFLLL